MKTKQLTEEKVFAYMREHHMLEPGDRVVAGISGGADSVCLLFVLLEWAKRVPLELVVVHVNHGIRAEAAEDAGYVEQLCRERDIPFYLIEENVRQRAEDWKCSEEDAGRRVRYEAFARIAQEYGANKIAVAHNSNDRSETMLFHLFRGSGIKGLGSIRPVRENIIRPILCLERREIEDYLQEQGIKYCQDATNSTDDYTRNRIRHNILPYAEEEIVQGCVRHMAQTAEMLSETEDYLEQQTTAAIAECVSHNKVSVKVLLQYHPVIQKRILHTMVKMLSPGQKDISYVHIQDLLGLFTGEGNRMVCLPFGIRGRREYDYVIIEKITEDNQKDSHNAEAEKQKENILSEGIPIYLPQKEDLQRLTDWEKEIVLDDDQILKLSILAKKELIPRENGAKKEENSLNEQEVPQNQYTKWFDYDKIKGCPEVRYRRIGDYLTISDKAGNMIHKSLKDYMINQKIPRTERDSNLLLAEGSHVLWLAGYRISEYYKISENTKFVLQVQLIRKRFTEGEMEENNGRTR